MTRHFKKKVRGFGNTIIPFSDLTNVPKPAEDPTVWFKADDLDGARNATLSTFQELTGAVNYATSGSTGHSAVGTNFTVVTSVGPTYQDTRLAVTPAFYVQQGFTQWVGSTDEAFELLDIALSGVILDDTWEVYAVGRSRNWPAGGNEYDRARIIGGEDPSTYWGLLSVNNSGDKWSGYAYDNNATYVRGTGLDNTDQIIRYRGERVTGSVYQYLKVDADAESEVLMGTTGIDEGTPSDGMGNTPRIGGSNSTNEYEGNIYEILVYNRVLTEQERSDTYDYLYAKWLNHALLPFPTPDFDPPDNSTVSNFEFSGWPGTVANPITSSDFTTYDNSTTSSYEFSGWPGTVANPITSSDFATYDNSATASYEPPGWTPFGASADLSTQYEYEQEWPGTLSAAYISGALATQFTASANSASTQYEFAQEWPGTLSAAYISGALATQFTASANSASTTYEFDGWPGTTDPPT